MSSHPAPAPATTRAHASVLTSRTLCGATVALTVRCPGGWHTRTGVVESTFGRNGAEELWVVTPDGHGHEAHSDDVVVIAYAPESDECDTCENTGRITVIAWDDHGPYEATGGPCPDCR